MGIVSVRIPSCSASASASAMLPALENRDGMSTPTTWSAPSASAAIAATSDESMPPESPISTSAKPFLVT